MNCFNHTDRPAVGQCSNCGKFLCKECVSKYKSILCDECANDIMVANEVDEKKRVRNCTVAGAAIVIVSLFLLGSNFGIGDIGELFLNPSAFIALLATMFLLFCLPWGWSLFDNALEKMRINVILPIPVYIAIKVVAAIYLGWLMFLIYIGKRIIKKS